MNKSIWQEMSNIRKRDELKGDIDTEVVVIGAGMAGLLTAYFLQESGRRVVVLEANRIGSGQTAGTTAKLTSQHGLIYAKLIKKFGWQQAVQYAKANEMAVEEMRGLGRELGFDIRDCAAFLYSCKDEHAFDEELEAARLLELPVSITTDTELPFAVKCAIRMDGQACIQPLQVLDKLAERLDIYEKSQVIQVSKKGEEEQGDKVTVCTNKGKVTADQVVFACHFPFINVPGYYFMRMHQERSYVLALKGTEQFEHMYLGIDGDKLSFRQAGDYLLLGGGGHRTGEFTKNSGYDILFKNAQLYWPESEEAYRWSAQDCMPVDGVPFIGRFSPSAPGWYVATGFGKWGMSTSMAAAKILTALIIEDRHSCAEVFDPHRFHFSASAGQMIEDGLKSAKGLIQEKFQIPAATLDKLPRGHGGVVETEEGKAGVYKDEQGKLFTVSVKCPHLGCQLAWNPDEKTWDCPCHGSRFDYKGKRLGGPAEEALNRPEEE